MSKGNKVGTCAWCGIEDTWGILCSVCADHRRTSTDALGLEDEIRGHFKDGTYHEGPPPKSAPNVEYKPNPMPSAQVVEDAYSLAIASHVPSKLWPDVISTARELMAHPERIEAIKRGGRA